LIAREIKNIHMGVLERFFWLLLLLLFISACTKEASKHVFDMPEGSVMLEANTPQRVSQHMVLEIIGINDTRCPIGIVCSTGGGVSINLKVLAQNGTKNYIFDYNKSKGIVSDTIENHIVEVVEITPYRFANDSIIDLNDYRIVVDVKYPADE
jgi:hypothetical protein